MSLNSLGFIKHSRRDDLESFVYNLINFLVGKLPWDDVDSESVNDMVRLVRNSKRNATFVGIPKPFKQLLAYAKGLKFQEEPNYEYCRNILKKFAEENKIQYDYAYDWTV